MCAVFMCLWLIWFMHCLYSLWRNVYLYIMDSKPLYKCDDLTWFEYYMIHVYACVSRKAVDVEVLDWNINTYFKLLLNLHNCITYFFTNLIAILLMLLSKTITNFKGNMKCILKLQSVTFGTLAVNNRTACVLWKNIVAGATSLCLCQWRVTQVLGYSAAVPTQTSLK